MNVKLLTMNNSKFDASLFRARKITKNRIYLFLLLRNHLF